MSDSGWTPDLLREHLAEVLAQTERRLDERIDALRDSFEDRARAQADAIGKAEQANERRFEGVNEFRGQLADQQRTFVPRTEIESTVAALTTRINVLGGDHADFIRRAEHETLTARMAAAEARLISSEGKDEGSVQRIGDLRQRILIYVAISGLLITLAIALLDHFFSK